MKQISNILCIAALFAMGATTIGCNSLKEEMALPRTVTLSSTVGFDENSTKALTAEGVKTFAAGETIALFYTNESLELVKTTYTFEDEDLINGGRQARITVSMTEPKADGAVRYIYPDAMSNPDGSENFAALAGQDGTLESLAASLDLATYDGTLTSEATLPANVTLSNQLAIGEFTVKKWDGTAITDQLTSFTVSDGTYTYTVAPAASATNFSDAPIYVAMRPVTDDKVLTFTAATAGVTTYTRTITGKALGRNNMYPVNLKMMVDVSAIDADELPEDGNVHIKYYDVADGEAITGTVPTGKGFEIRVPRGATVTLAGITQHAGTYSDGIRCLGDAQIILAAGTSNDLTRGAENAYSGLSITDYGTLTISGDGTLLASGGYEYPGIGGYWSNQNIVINGGAITATGGYNAPGIGASNNGGSCGNISINGGTVTATGGDNAPGIGAGFQDSRCCKIIFRGGITTATGGYNAPGIGAGRSGEDKSQYIEGIFFFDGCIVTAYGGLNFDGRFTDYYINDVQDWELTNIYDTFVFPIPQPAARQDYSPVVL